MSKRKTSPPYHHGDLANELKKQALIIIKKNGLDNLNLRSLADQCGVSATAVYRHFDNKDHLLAVLAEEGLAKLQKMVLMQEDPHRLQKMGLAYIKFALQDPLRFQLIVSDVFDKSQFPSLINKNHLTYQLLKSEVERCIQNGSMVGDVNALSYTAWSTVHGISMLLIEDHFLIAKNLEEKIRFAIEITTIVGRGLMRVDR